MMSRCLFSLIIGLTILSCNQSHDADNNHAHDHDANDDHQEQKKEYKEVHQHGENHANHHMHNTPVEDLIKSFDSKDREITQKPNEVIALLGDIRDKKILDIGSGSGYFSFRMADKGAYVIAGDVNNKFHAHIKSKMEENELYAEHIEIRKLPYDSPFLHSGEVDHAIIVNTYHHIEKRPNYFNQVKTGLKNEGILMVVDFKKQKFEEEIQGPPYEMRIAKEVVIDELKEAGFTDFEINDELLPYQYIIMAKK